MTASSASAPIVVGVDGSRDSARALEWAVRLADRERRPITLLHAADGRREAAVLDEATATAHRLAPAVPLRSLGVTEGPRQALRAASETASVVTIGARGTGLLSGLRLGSVAQFLTRHAACPVVVTRSVGAGRPPGVLVGTDLSARCGTVLEFAFRVAEAQCWPLTALHCFWDASRETGDLDPVAAARLPEAERLDEIVQQHAARHPDVRTSTLLSRGFADKRLLTGTLDTGLVVLGHRELPWLEALVYGHVSPIVVEHAVGDVAVVPEAARTEMWP